LRSSGLPSVPSEDVVALLKAPPANRSADVREALAARLLVTPRVQQSDEQWQVSLDADDGGGQHYAVEARARDVAAAARAAADKLLVALGRGAGRLWRRTSLRCAVAQAHRRRRFWPTIRMRRAR
jgi:hypothetical protein